MAAVYLLLDRPGRDVDARAAAAVWGRVGLPVDGLVAADPRVLAPGQRLLGLVSHEGHVADLPLAAVVGAGVGDDRRDRDAVVFEVLARRPRRVPGRFVLLDRDVDPVASALARRDLLGEGVEVVTSAELELRQPGRIGQGDLEL